MGNSQSRARSHYLDIAREALEATQHLREEVGVRGPAWRGRRTRRDDAIVLYLEGRYDDKDLVINVSAIAVSVIPPTAIGFLNYSMPSFADE